jgi:hypothetical protein
MHIQRIDFYQSLNKLRSLSSNVLEIGDDVDALRVLQMTTKAVEQDERPRPSDASTETNYGKGEE